MIALLSAFFSDKIFFSWSTTSLSIWYTISAVFLAWLTSYLHKRYSVWSRQGIRGPKPIPIFGNTLDYFFKPNKDVDISRIKKYGRIFGAFNALEPLLVVSDPKILRKILVQDFWSFTGRRSYNHWLLKQFLISKNGQEWKEMRSVISPTFTSGKMKQMLPLMKESLVSMEKTIDKIVKNGEGNRVDSKKLFGCFTLDVIAKCAFATETNAHENENDAFIEPVRRFFKYNKLKVMMVLLLPNFIKDFFNITAQPAKSVDFMANVAKQIMDNRRRESQYEKRSYPDLLQLMMSAGKSTVKEQVVEDTVDNEAHHGNEDEVTRVKPTDSHKMSLTDHEIMANTILVLVAGYETTATTITFTSYSLAINPRVQDRLRTEVNDALNSNGGDLSYEVLSGLKYLDAVISETLRMFPPVIRVERIADEDCVLDTEDGQKIQIKKGNVIYVPIYAIQHDKEFYDDPEEYRPERFLPENRHKLVPYTYLPFVAGPRNCIGMRFALMEAKLAIAHLVHKYKFKRSDRTAVPLDFSKSSTLLQAKEIIIGIKPVN